MDTFHLIPFKQNLVENHDNSFLYNSAPWIQCLIETYDFEIFLLKDHYDRVHVPICFIDDELGKRYVSLPFSDYILFPYSNTSYYDKIFDFLKGITNDADILLKTNLETDFEWDKELKRSAVYHRVSLAQEGVNMNKSFDRGVRKAVSSNVKARIRNDLQALKSFYELYHQLRFEKFKSIPQPFLFFKNIYHHFIQKGRGFIFEATIEGKVIASIIILFCGNTAYYKFGSSHKDYLEYRPNNLLFSELIKHLKQEGIQFLDLGLSGTGEKYAGLRRWKKHMGGVEHPISYWGYKCQREYHESKAIQSKREHVQAQVQQIISEDLDSWKTSVLSEKLYPYFA